MLLADCDPPCEKKSQHLRKRSKSSRPEADEGDAAAAEAENERQGERPAGLTAELLVTLLRAAARKAAACGVKGSQGKSLTALPQSTGTRHTRQTNGNGKRGRAAP